MRLRTRLLLALLPLGLVMALLGGAAIRLTTEMGDLSDRILRDNYRSVLAAQRMKEAIERIDSAATFRALGRDEKAAMQEGPSVQRFEAELRVQEGNLTEQGEADDTLRLRSRWNSYLAQAERFRALPPAERTAAYFATMEPAFLEVKAAADRVLDLNQDAMVRKSEEARRGAARNVALTAFATLLALVAGALASGLLTRQALRPLGHLSQAVRRLGEGDLSARAVAVGSEKGGDEIAALAREFDAMAQSLEGYRRSSLGELIAAQQASQAAIDSLPDPVVVLSVGGGVSNVNEAAVQLLRIGSGPAAGDPLAPVEPAIRALLERVRAHVLSGKGPYVPRGFEESVRLDAPDGAHWLLPRATPVQSEDSGVVGVSVVLQDVTRLMRFDELKNDLVATVAHEFRTPLTSLRMAIHLCLEGLVGPLTPKQEEMLRAGRTDCERLQAIVDDLLDLSRLQAGKADVVPSPQPARGLLLASLEPRREDAQRAGVQVEVAPEPSGEPLPAVLADPERIDLVLGNFISNALMHAPQDSRVLLLAERAGAHVRFSVSDQGPGLAKEHQHRVFEKFFRVPGAKGGVGLGLYIAREVVRAHGGEIGVDSVPGEGATFWFTLPVV
jgi:signal transduction histidine kinase/HAMP domain-containing protein